MIAGIKRLHRSNRRGSALVSVLLVFCVFVVLSMAVMALALSSSYQAAAQSNNKQAYFTARSSVNAAMNYVKNNNNAIQSVIDNIRSTDVNKTIYGNFGFSNGTSGELNSLQVTPVKWDTDGKPILLKVVTTAKVKGVSSTAIAYMKKTTSGVVTNPFSNIFYSTGSGTFSFGSNTDIIGNIYTAGLCDITTSTKFYGNIYAKNGVVLENGGIIVNGDIFTDKDIVFNSSGKVTGNGICGGSAIFNNWDSYIYKSLTAGGSYTPNDSNNHICVPNTNSYGTILTNQSVSKLNMNVDFSSTNTAIKSFFSQFDAMTPIDISGDMTISSSGYLASYTSGGCTVKVDTSFDDICINVDSSYFSNSTGSTGKGKNKNPSASTTVDLNNIRIEVTGPHNLYINLTGNTTLEVSGGSPGPIITMKGYNNSNMSAQTVQKPKVYVIGLCENGNTQAVDLESDAEIDGFIYLPNGKFSAAGGAGPNGYCVYGSAISNGTGTFGGSAGTWKQINPDLSGTPLSGLASYTLPVPPGGVTNTSWSFDGWGDQ